MKWPIDSHGVEVTWGMSEQFVDIITQKLEFVFFSLPWWRQDHVIQCVAIDPEMSSNSLRRQQELLDCGRTLALNGV